ncbi:hypothetical protein [Anaerococcus sp.]|uniref:hypothetical protein n=1 Tax=Anaerococcus sp. TaxID=1872515 RepID=UPI0027B89F00|nr:hypothetical protein [Anaerococcus sp.]
MEFSPIPISDQKFLNFIFIGILAGKKPVTAMFATKGNTLIPQSLADEIDLDYIDKEPIDQRTGFRRAKLSTMAIGGLKLIDVPVVVCKDEIADLGKDPSGNKFPADMILGWNIISQLVFRGDLRKGRMEVQSSDLKKKNSKSKENFLVFKIICNKRTYKAALDTSLPFTRISENIAKGIKIENKDIEQTIQMLEIDEKEINYESKFSFKIDDNTISVPSTKTDPALNDEEIQIIFGADLLRSTSWALYNPMGYVRVNK